MGLSVVAWGVSDLVNETGIDISDYYGWERSSAGGSARCPGAGTSRRRRLNIAPILYKKLLSVL